MSSPLRTHAPLRLPRPRPGSKTRADGLRFPHPACWTVAPRCGSSRVQPGPTAHPGRLGGSLAPSGRSCAAPALPGRAGGLWPPLVGAPAPPARQGPAMAAPARPLRPLSAREPSRERRRRNAASCPRHCADLRSASAGLPGPGRLREARPSSRSRRSGRGGFMVAAAVSPAFGPNERARRACRGPFGLLPPSPRADSGLARGLQGFVERLRRGTVGAKGKT